MVLLSEMQEWLYIGERNYMLETYIYINIHKVKLKSLDTEKIFDKT